MDPQQELFTKLLTEIKALGYDVYDGFLPPDGTPYPFVYFADNQQIDEANKTAVFGSVHQTIHVWCDNPKRRAQFQKCCWRLKIHAENWIIPRILHGTSGM